MTVEHPSDKEVEEAKLRLLETDFAIKLEDLILDIKAAQPLGQEAVDQILTRDRRMAAAMSILNGLNDCPEGAVMSSMFMSLLGDEPVHDTMTMTRKIYENLEYSDELLISFATSLLSVPEILEGICTVGREEQMSKRKQISKKQIDKAFAVITSIGAAFKSIDVLDSEKTNLIIRVDQMMKVYSRKVGHKHYWNVSNRVAVLWESITATVSEKAARHFIACLSVSINANDFVSLLALKSIDVYDFYSQDDLTAKEKTDVVNLTLLLVNKIDEEFNTHNDMHNLLPKVKKSKKIRPKIKSKAQLKHEKEQEDIKLSAQRRKEALTEMIRKAKERKNEILSNETNKQKQKDI